MAWRQPGNKPLSKPIVVGLLMHICVTRPQWVKEYIVVFVKHCFGFQLLKWGDVHMHIEQYKNIDQYMPLILNRIMILSSSQVI